ncbi:hypothetical protein GCM10007385_25140 [Tateyamaria omphalii]|nr:hypothetical protein GCM10007385_25140 [Tateyamaria omphalii]
MGQIEIHPARTGTSNIINPAPDYRSEQVRTLWQSRRNDHATRSTPARTTPDPKMVKPLQAPMGVEPKVFPLDPWSL